MMLTKEPIQRPAICLWLKAYCVVMLLLLGVLVVIALRMIFTPDALLEGETAYQRNPEGTAALLSFFGVVFAVICGVPMIPLFAFLVWPRSPLAWYAGVAAILAGLLTSFGWIATVPLAIFWNQPHVREFYGLPVRPKNGGIQ